MISLTQLSFSYVDSPSFTTLKWLQTPRDGHTVCIHLCQYFTFPGLLAIQVQSFVPEYSLELLDMGNLCLLTQTLSHPCLTHHFFPF